MNDLFVKKSDKQKIEFYIYFDRKLNICFSRPTKEAVSKVISDFNKSILEANAAPKEDGVASTLDSEEANKINIDVSSIDKEDSETSESIEFSDSGIVQIKYNENNVKFISLIVKEPNHSDISYMLSESTVIHNNNVRIDINKYNDMRVRNLIVDWNIKDEEKGTKIPITPSVWNELHPKIFDIFAFQISVKIPLYLDSLVV